MLLFSICFGLTRSGFAVGKITAFDITAGHWGGPHKIFLSFSSESALSESDYTNEDFRLFINGSAVFPFQLNRLNQKQPLHLLILSTFDGFKESLLAEIQKTPHQLEFSELESSMVRILYMESGGNSGETSEKTSR